MAGRRQAHPVRGIADRLLQSCRSFSRASGAEGRLLLTGDGFVLERESRERCPLHWTRVHRISDYKADLWTTDLIHLDFDLSGSEVVFTIHEEIPGFDDVVARAGEVFAIDMREALAGVARPAFASSVTVLYEHNPGLRGG